MYKDIEKQRAAQRRYYERNKDKVKSVARDRRNLVVKFLQEYKQSRGCMDCEIMYPYWVLHFDHRPGEVKIAGLAEMLTRVSLDKVKEEVAKCDVVCANCHADRTHDRIVSSGSSVLAVSLGE